MVSFIALAAIAASLEKPGLDFKIETSREKIDPARSVMLSVVLKTDRGVQASLPDLRERLEGFSVAEDYEDEPVSGPDGSTVRRANWKLVPEPVAGTYRIAPLAVGGYVTKAYYFEPPGAVEAPEGPVETDPSKDMPPLSMKMFLAALAALAAVSAALFCFVRALRFIARRVREHRMSPIERAWAELARLVGRGLPERGRYKDFYVELTMVVRRYVQRKYGVKAPHLTTEEFLSDRRFGGSDSLRAFLESADMVKFAGVKATPEMADAATAAARGYLKDDNSASASGREGE